MSNPMKNMRTVLLMLFAALAFSVSAQTITLSGNVKDSTGEPIIGASVVEKGNSSNGTITNLDGHFSLKVPAKATLVISYIGMKTQEVALKGQTMINVTLADDSQALDEVVVIGYGTAKRSDLTGSVSSVGAKDLATIPVTNAAEAITGKMAGVQVTTTEGSPDAEIKIRVRGGGSISQDNSPLYIVDGFPVSSISDIAPTDIQTIDVLKDASSTAIYGARGANGVIIITTKSGKEGKVQVALNASFGVKRIAKELEVLNPYEYVMYQYELDPQTGNNTATTFNNYYGMYDDLSIYKADKGINWQDEVFGRTGTQQNYNVSISGGNKSTRFNISFTRADEKAIMIGSGFEKNNLNAKINTEINKYLSLDFNTRLSYQVIDGASVSEGSGANTKLRNAVKYAPTKGLKGFDASLDDDQNNAESASLLYDPLKSIEDEYRKQKKFSNNYNMGVNWKVIKGLQLRAEGGYQFDFFNTDNVYGPSTSTSKNNGGQPILNLLKQDFQSWREAVTLSYEVEKLFKWRDRLNIMIGEEATSAQTTKTVIESRYFPSDMTIGEILATPSYGKPQPTTTNIGADDRLFSYFGRINYSAMDRYLLTATVRADASSKFAKGNRWGYFPSAALAWRVSEEAFMSNTQEWLSNLKLRLSIGMAGNNRIPVSYKHIYSSATGTPYYYANEEINNQLNPSTSLPNPNLKWETTVTRNAGVDFGLFNGRLTGTLDLYYNTTKDLLIQSPIAANSGYATQYQNIGKTSNRGIELSLEGYIIDTKDFSLSASFNISFNKNKIDAFSNGNSTIKGYSSKWNGSSEPLEDFLVEQGYSVGRIYGYETDGMYSFDDFTFNATTKRWDLKPGVADNSAITSANNYFGPGALKFKNSNGSEDNKVDVKDKTVIGNTNPLHTGGFNLTARYKWIDLSAFFNWSYGNDIYNANKIDYSAYMLTRKYQNLTSNFSLANRFTTIDPATGLNIYSGANANPARLQELNQDASIWMPIHTQTPLHSWAVEDGSFLRLNNLSIGFTLPKTWVKKANIENLRIYFTGYNLYCWTSYSGYDPEVDTRSKNSPLTPGVDYSAYPKSRTFVGGINVTF